MRFEVVAAFAMGALLPILETIRRGLAHWAVDFMTMFEDYLGGALLLAGAFAAVRAKPYASTLLLAAWAAVTSMMNGSLWHHLETTLRREYIEPNNSGVLACKLLLWITCVTALVGAYRRVLAERAPR